MAEPELYGSAFPTLDDEQIAALGSCARTSAKHFHDGETCSLYVVDYGTSLSSAEAKGLAASIARIREG